MIGLVIIADSMMMVMMTTRLMMMTRRMMMTRMMMTLRKMQLPEASPPCPVLHINITNTKMMITILAMMTARGVMMTTRMRRMMTLRRKRQSPEASPSCFRRPTTGASAQRMHLWKFELITSNDDDYEDDDDGACDDGACDDEEDENEDWSKCTNELITSNDYYDHFDASYQKHNDHDGQYHEDWDDGPWKRPGQAKSHIKLSFIALVACDTHRNMWHRGVLSAESPTVAVSTTCIKWHQVQKKCTWLSLKCKILLLCTNFDLKENLFEDQENICSWSTKSTFWIYILN